MTQEQRLKRLFLQGRTLTTLSVTRLEKPIMSFHRVLTTLRNNNPKLKIASNRIQTNDSFYYEYYVPRRDLIDFLNNEQ